MIPARFHRLRNRAMAVSDRAFAEPVRLSFFKSGSVDPARPIRDIEAILRVRAGELVKIGSNGLSLHSQLAELHINRTAYPDLVILTGDKVRAMARPGQPWFTVSTVESRTDGRLVLKLGA